MQGLTHRWIFRDHAARGGTLLERVLAARGMTRHDASFREPRLTDLHDPSLMPGLDAAAERVISALRARDPVVIWGDYDVDGVTAAAILYRLCRAIAPDAPVRTFIPHRIDEGYGLNAAGIQSLAVAGARVVVTVDCGVTARAEADLARRLGVDLIITDHHTPPASPGLFPEAFCIVHPSMPGSAYPFRDLSGAGVAYKLAWRLATLASGSERVGESLRNLLIDLLPFAALGTIADVVPLLGENRIIARFGLQRIKATPFIGLRALIGAAGLAGEDISSEAVGFRLGPRLNAAGRMGHADDALELLLTDDPRRAAQLAAELTRLNDRRRAAEIAITEKAVALAEHAGMTRDDRRAIVLAHEGWSVGVVGIACSRLVDRFHRPTILLSHDGETCHGSCRSIDGFDIHAALEACAEHLETFGGHAMAAGLRVRADRLDLFADAFTQHANDRLRPSQLVPSLGVDCGAEIHELDRRSVGGLMTLAPFGRDNPPPAIALRRVRIAEAPRPIGADGRHLKITISENGAALRVVAWNWGARREELRAGAIIDAVVEPKLNCWRGVDTVEPTLKDLAIVGR